MQEIVREFPSASKNNNEVEIKEAEELWRGYFWTTCEDIKVLGSCWCSLTGNDCGPTCHPGGCPRPEG